MTGAAGPPVAAGNDLVEAYVADVEGWKDHVEGHPELSEAYDQASSCL